MGSTARRWPGTWQLKVLFVVGSFAAAGLVAAGVVSGADQASISSDQSEYAPGDAVALSGSGWQAGEAVQVLVDDDQDDPWSHEAELVAAVDGTVSDSFDLPDVEGGYSVTATAPSEVASATFTVSAPTQPPPLEPMGTPALDSDEEEYDPGATVTLSGADWQPGDTVEIAVNDDAEDAWDHSADVTVAPDGTISDAFDLPDDLTAEFTATATDSTDRTATATFETVSEEFGEATEPYLVRFASGTSAATQAQILAAARAEDLSYIAPLRIHGVLLPGGAGLQTSIDMLRSNSSVTRVEPDRVREAGGTPNDSAYGDQWSLPKIGWDNVFGEVSVNGTARVAILDTGVDGSHPDLNGNVVPGTSILDSSNGLTDPNGHGTAMAGIVAAETNNGLGVAGVGYAGVQVMPVTVLDSAGTGQDSAVIEGVVYAVENDADVILMAFSNPGYSELLQAAIDYAWDEGVVLVAATGNDGSSAVTFPAGDRGVIGVSNTDQSDALNGSSNFGQAVFLGAPGTNIASTSAGGGYTSISGTSASAAEVAGAAALLKAASGASNGVVVSRLARNAEAAGSQQHTGNGRLNLDRALRDTSTGATQPAGAAPIGGGGPFVGPYVAAAKSVSVNDRTLAEGNVGTTTMAFTVSTNGAGTGTVSFTTAPSGANPATEGTGTCDPGEDYIDSSGILTFTQSGGGNEPKTINVTICGDSSFEPNETFTVTLANPTPSGGSGMNLGDGTGIGTITNDDAANTAPTIGVVDPPVTANEGQTRTYNFTITDPDVGNTFTFVSGFPTCGTGGTVVSGSASIDSVAKTGTFQCFFADGHATPTVQVRVQDNAGAQSNTPSFAVTVANVPPSIAISGAASVNEGSSYILTLGAVTDPGADTVTSYVVHWGDGATDTYASAGAKTHTYADGLATRAITVDLVDEDGTHLDRGNAHSVQVNNVAPSIAISGAASVNEGSSYSLTLGAVTDPGTDTISSYVVHWDDGATDTYGSAGVKTHTYADGPANHAVTVDLVDEDGTHLNRANALSVQVDNVPPTITAVTASSPVDEGDSSTVSVAATDPAGPNDPLSYQFDCDGNAMFEVGPLAGSSHSCSFADNGTFTVNVRVTDGDGGADTDSTAVVVDNIAPSIAISGATNVNEGSAYSLTLGAVTDPGTDTVSSYVVHWGDGTSTTYTTNGVKTHIYADGPDDHAITVDLVDEDGTFLDRANALSVHVNNVPPSIAISGAANVNEGSAYSLTLGAVTDPGTDTVTSYVVHWGDGTSTTYGTNGVKTHTYADGPANRAITVDLVDEDGTFLDRANALSVQVDNVAPSIAISGAASVNEGSAYSLTLGAVADPGTDTLSSYVVHWGDGTSTTYATNGVKTHTYADGPDDHVIMVDLVDEDGTFLDRANALSVQVDNVPPSIAIGGAASVDEGSAYSLTVGAVTDPGTDTVSSYVVHWGDGTSTTYATNGVKTHTYADGPDDHAITVDLVDEDGTFLNRANALSVHVDNIPPTVTLAATNTYTWPESATAQRTFDYTASDPAGASDPLTMTFNCGTGGDFVAGSGTATSFKCRFPDGPASPSVSVSANDGDGGVGSDSHAITVNNVPPTVTLAATNTYTWPESATAERTFDYTASDPAGASDPLTMTFICGTGGDFVAGSGTATSFKCRFPDGPATPTVSVSANDGDGGVGSDSHAVTVSNVAPTVAKPTFQPVLVACQTTTMLTGISFSDPGVNDNPWTVDIDWGDSSAHTTYVTATQGAQPNQSHTYAAPGPHTATVTVTDRDTGTGSNTSTAPVNVFQYTVDFLPPFDDSTPSGLIVNKMKNGRVVPVKARIRDECAGALLVDPARVVTIKVTKTSGSGTGDPIEEYADAGQSSAGTNEFRPTGDHWIYNLDSKALGLVINNLYRVDVFVDGDKATVSNWAVLQPVK